MSLFRDPSSFKALSAFLRSKRSLRGLWEGVDVKFGNKVSHSEQKTRRKFEPNVTRKRLWSVALNGWVKISVSTAALRSIDKAGGLDDYMIKLKESGIKDEKLLLTYNLIKDAIAEREKWAEEALAEGKVVEASRIRLGLQFPSSLCINVGASMTNK